MEQTKLDGLLGLCRKSGKMILGTDMVLSAVRSEKRKPALVLYAEDVSQNTKKRICNGCTYHHIELRELPLNCGNLGHLLGKSSALAVIGITDEGFSKAICKHLPKEQTPRSSIEEQWEENI